MRVNPEVVFQVTFSVIGGELQVSGGYRVP